MKTWLTFFSSALISFGSVFGTEGEFLELISIDEEPVNVSPAPAPPKHRSDGWSLELGNQYTWFSFTTPPTYSGSSGGIQGKITYQKPYYCFGQVRSIYNIGGLSSSVNDSDASEWYTEFIAGFCIPVWKRWTLTPYAGIGLDFIQDDHSSYSIYESIGLDYNTYYAMFGFDSHYTWENWMVGLQAECLPIFSQYLKIGGLSGSGWSLTHRTGAAARIPLAYRLARSCWFEVAPYYRFLPIGSSSVLSLTHRNLSEWGSFFTFRFFL